MLYFDKTAGSHITFEQWREPSCRSLLPVFMLTKANRLLALAPQSSRHCKVTKKWLHITPRKTITLRLVCLCMRTKQMTYSVRFRGVSSLYASYANRLLASAPYLAHRHESGSDPFI